MRKSPHDFLKDTYRRLRINVKKCVSHFVHFKFKINPKFLQIIFVNLMF